MNYEWLKSFWDGDQVLGYLICAALFGLVIIRTIYPSERSRGWEVEDPGPFMLHNPKQVLCVLAIVVGALAIVLIFRW